MKKSVKKSAAKKSTAAKEVAKKATPKKTIKKAKTTKKVPAKKPSKKVSKKKEKETSNPKRGKSRVKGSAKDREVAKNLGLCVIHFRVLRSLGKNPKVADRLSYRDIEKRTGYYSILAGILHTNKQYGLVPLGLARVGEEDRDGRDITVFSITPKGRKLIAKAK